MFGTASFFLTAGEEVVPHSGVTHYQYCMEQWWRERKLSLQLFVGSAEPLLIPRITASESTYIFVQNCHGINVIDTVQTHFHPLFPEGFFFSIWLSTRTTCSLFSSAAGHFTIYSQSIVFSTGTATWFRSTARSPSSHSFSLYQVITACSCISLKAR